jgi:6-phosphogluconate dehydrogenase
MEIGMIGLGRMGANMAQRLLRGGHAVIGCDPDAAARARHEDVGGSSTASLEELVSRLRAPRVLWLMVPAGDVTERSIAELSQRLSPGDTVVDGGNSYYQDTLRRGAELARRQIDFVDCGTSGGVWGLAQGYSLMVGGEPASVERLRPLLACLAPAHDRGWGRVGPVGAGHFVKMVHNGIEYGLMQAYAEGFSILAHKREFGLDLAGIAGIWREGSVVRSWLLDLVAASLDANPSLSGIAPLVADSGEGRWTVAEAIALNVPAPIITASLLERLRSRDRESFADRLLAALRGQFGGHAVARE